MTAILASDVFPFLDTKNPLDSRDEDEVPQRFGPKWFQYEREERKQQQDEGSRADDEEETHQEKVFSKVDEREIEDLDNLIDHQRRLLFTETRMKAAPDNQGVEDEA